MRRLSSLPLLLVLSCGEVPPPIADPGPDRDVKVGEEIELDGSGSTGEIERYRWSFEDGSPDADGVKVRHAFEREGATRVTLTVTGPGGSNGKSALVHVACAAQAVLKVLSQEIKPAEELLFDATASLGCSGAKLTAYEWDFGDGTKVSGADKAQVTHTYAESGTYSLVLRVVDEKGFEGRASRTLNVGISAGKPLVTCAPSVEAKLGVAASFTASASDPGGGTIAAYDWTFSDGGSASGATVSHTFASEGAFTASVIVATQDGRKSDACTTQVTVKAPVSYSGSWLLNPSSASLTGCQKFTVGFPATRFEINHTGTAMDAEPTGNGWPAGAVLSGSEEPPPAAAGTFRLRKKMPLWDSGSQCGQVSPDHSVELTFNSPTTVSGTWKIVYEASCLPGCGAQCNCVAQGTFTGKKQ